MAFVAISPSPPLAPYVARLWDCEMPPVALRYERILPTPGASLIINLLEDETRTWRDASRDRCERTSGSSFGGPRAQSFVIDTAEQQFVMGVEFQPGGAHAFAREPLDRLSERDYSLEDLFGDTARRLRRQLLQLATPAQRLAALDAWLRLRCEGAQAEPAIVWALQALARGAQLQRIGSIVRASGLSPRRFDTLFKAHAGIGPKRYARLLRLRAVVDDVHGHARVDWSRVAADCGYYDQPHLVREFRAYCGMTPSAYVARDTPYANHVPLT